MTIKDVQFIIETLQEAIGWAEYAPSYFQEKHNLDRDQEAVLTSIKLLESLDVQAS